MSKEQEKKILELTLDTLGFIFRAAVNPLATGPEVFVDMAVTASHAAIDEQYRQKSVEELHNIAQSTLDRYRNIHSPIQSLQSQINGTYMKGYKAALTDALQKLNSSKTPENDAKSLAEKFNLSENDLKSVKNELQAKINEMTTNDNFLNRECSILQNKENQLKEEYNSQLKEWSDALKQANNEERVRNRLVKLPEIISELETVVKTLQSKIQEKTDEMKDQTKTDNLSTIVPDITSDTPPAGLSQALNLVAVALGKVADALQVSIVQQPRDIDTSNSPKNLTQNPPMGSSKNWKDAWDAGIDDSIKSMGTWSENMENVAKKTAQSMQSAMSSFFFDAVTGKLKNLGDYITGFLNSVLKAMTDVMANMFTKSILSGLHFNIPGNATGGPVSAGSTYIVGEKGPEIFVPSSGGTIIPNHKINSFATLSTAPQVTVNVINKPGQPANSKQESPFNGQKYVVDMWLDALNRNVGGIRDVVRAGSR